MAGSISDIDARKRAEEALRQSEERYALAMAGSSGGHWVWETQTDALFVSDKVNQLFGVPPDHEATTRSAFFERVQLFEGDRERLTQIGDDLRTGRLQRADYEFRIVLPEAQGGQRWILSRARVSPTRTCLPSASVKRWARLRIQRWPPCASGSTIRNS